MYCGECGVSNPETNKFCSDCGALLNFDSEISQMPEVRAGHSNIHPNRPRPPGTAPKQRTDLLSFVIILNYIGIVLLVIISIFTLLISFLLAIFYGLATLFAYWLLQGLKSYDNNRRLIYLAMLVISFLISLFDFDLIALTIGGIQFYALALHAPTVKLFD